MLGGAVGVTVIAFRFVLHLPKPILENKFYLPTRKDLDFSLIVGAAIFGIGWGIAGYCPGPGITALVLGTPNPVLFIVAFIVGSLIYQWYKDLSLNDNSSEATRVKS